MKLINDVNSKLLNLQEYLQNSYLSWLTTFLRIEWNMVNYGYHFSVWFVFISVSNFLTIPAKDIRWNATVKLMQEILHWLPRLSNVFSSLASMIVFVQWMHTEPNSSLPAFSWLYSQLHQYHLLVWVTIWTHMLFIENIIYYQAGYIMFLDVHTRMRIWHFHIKLMSDFIF